VKIRRNAEAAEMINKTFNAEPLTLFKCREIFITAIIEIRHTVIQNKFPVYRISNPLTKADKKLRDNMEVCAEFTQYL
jgi:hypothetical protein